MIWKFKSDRLDLSYKGAIMGILNATPDSFSDGGEHDAGEDAIDFALQMILQGARIIDIGGESTRPGAPLVSASEEKERVIPLIEKLRAQSDVLISIDTSKAEVAEAALEAGADILNDVTGLTGESSGKAMLEVCKKYEAGVVVMHMQGSPRSMQNNPQYHHPDGVVGEVGDFFEERLDSLLSAGLAEESICFDPGIGFGKTLANNVDLLKNLGVLQERFKRPLLLGVSRKSIIGAITGEENPASRDVGTSAITAMATLQGIRLHRVHDVKANLQAMQLAEALIK